MKKLVSFLLLAIVILMTGCNTAPKYQHEAFKVESIDRIVVMPFIDNRQNPDPKHNFESMCGDALRSIMTELKYTRKCRAIYSTDKGGVSSYTVSDLPVGNENAKDIYSVDPRSVNTEWVKQLGPSSVEWVFVPVLENLKESNLVIQQSGGAVISLYLFNTKNGQLYWKDTGAGGFVSGFLTSTMMNMGSGQDHYHGRFAMESAGYRCLYKFPKHKGPYYLP